MKSALSLRLQRFWAYALGDLHAATALFDQDLKRAMASCKTPEDAGKFAKKEAANGVSGFGIGVITWLLFCAIDSRYVAPKWPMASMAWLAFWMATALLFAWHYYIPAGPAGWRRAWYQLTGNPMIDDHQVGGSIMALERSLTFWKRMALLTGWMGMALLLAGMALIRFALPADWTWLTFWGCAGVVALAVYWPNVHRSALNQAYHQMIAAKLFSGAD